MAENNVQLIQRILDGEKEAFSILVQKYQKRIHALAWRKTGDYHIAEEITQDTFLKVYKKLPTLKNPKQFDGWVYVIANRVCLNWFRKNKTQVQSIEDTPMEELERSFYTHYELEQRKLETTAHYRSIIKKLLAKLPESERTVLTLFYLGEMTAQEISKFLGVSVNTIKSRISRARNRLKAEEEHLITENLGSVQLSTDLTESIMRQVSDIKPSPPIAKPLLPWAAFGTAAVLVLLLLGTMHQYIAHFQKPYNFDALSEPTIEIVESPIHLNIISNPAARNKIVRGVTNSRSEGVGARVSDADFAANAQENGLNSSVVRWTQANGPQGSHRFNFFATSENSIHAVSSTSIYRLMEDKTTWMNINSNVPINTFQSPITEHQGVIYSVNANEIFASADGGETWNRFSSRPNGDAVGLIIKGNTQENFIMYLALQDEGVFRSADLGKEWFPLNNGLTGKSITTVATIGDSVFIGTNRGLYRLNLGVWKQLAVDPLKTVHSMAVFENNLYVLTGQDFLNPESYKMPHRIFHSTDLGYTWNEITPKNKSFIEKPLLRFPTKISAFDETLLVLGVPTFRSRDGGQTWTNLGFDINSLPSNRSSILAVNENTFYKVGVSGIIRTTDGGASWHSFMNGMVRTKMQDLVAFNNSLYVYTGSGFFKSADNGNSWEDVRIDYGEFIPTSMPTSNGEQYANYFTNSKLTIANNILYGITPQGKELRIFRLHPNDGVFSMVHRISSPKLRTSDEDAIDTNLLDIEEAQLKSGGFAVSGKTFYIEYMRRLFKWEPSSLKLTDTGLIDTGKQLDNESDRGFKLAASAETVYVGKRDGRLFQSFDGGNSWRDVTPNLPSSFVHIKDIMFIGTTVYVATDQGVLSSQTGEHWRMLTDNIGTNIIIDRFAMDESKFYGAGDMGAYRLDSQDKWKQISSNIPDKIISLSASHDKLYIATKQSGIFYTSIEEESPDVENVTISSIR